MTRIVAGSAKGRTLAVPKSGTRPTSERVREALFSRLDHMNVLDGTTVLDLYAGTGALGLEGLDTALELQDAADPLEVDALVLAHALDIAQALDVLLRVPPAPPFRAGRGHQAEAVVLAQGLRVHAGQLGGDRDHEGHGLPALP